MPIQMSKCIGCNQDIAVNMSEWHKREAHKCYRCVLDDPDEEDRPEDAEVAFLYPWYNQKKVRSLCECGKEKVSSISHSDWCPLFTHPDGRDK